MTSDTTAIAMRRGDLTVRASLTWRREGWRYAVTLSSDGFDPVEEVADDAFEALCRVRDHLEPRGWRIGVVGAQADVWPSGMARAWNGSITRTRQHGFAGQIAQRRQHHDHRITGYGGRLHTGCSPASIRL